MKRKKSRISFVKNLEVLKMASSAKVCGRVYYAQGGQKTQKARMHAWSKILAAIENNIPVVLLGNNASKEYIHFVKKNVKSLKMSNDVAFILFTSGSTGEPKSRQRTLAESVYSASYGIKKTGLTKNMIVGDYRGLNSYAGVHQFLKAVMVGAEIVFIDSEIDYVEVVRMAIRKKINYFNASAMQWHGIARALRELGVRWELKVGIVASGLVDEETKKILTSLTQCRLFSIYAMSEAGIVSYLDHFKYANKTKSVGIPVSKMTVKIMKGDKGVPVGEEGEIVIGSPYISPSVSNPYHTEDNGYFDKDGFLYVTGRKGDVLKINGRRVNITQLERAYDKYNSVVFGVPAEVLGNHEAAIVFETKDSLENIKEYVRNTKPPFNFVCEPRWIFVQKKLPLTISGKLDRVKIKKLFTAKIEKIKKENDTRKDSNMTETVVAKIFEEVLFVKGVRGSDCFFKLGGKSLRVLSLISTIRRKFKIEITPVQVFENSTVRKLAKIIDEHLCKYGK